MPPSPRLVKEAKGEAQAICLLRNLILMQELTDDKVVQTILHHGPITLEELGRMAYPVRAAYLALMLSWAKQHGLDRLIEQRDALKPMVLRGLEEIGEMIQIFWDREDPGKPKDPIK